MLLSIGSSFDLFQQTPVMSNVIEAEAFSVRLREAIAAAGHDVDARGFQADMSRRYRVAGPTVFGWLNGKHKADPANARKLATEYRVGYEWLYFGRGPKAPDIPAYAIKTDEDAPEDGDVMVDVTDIELAAGAGAEAPHFVETVYRHTYRAEFLRSIGVKAENVRRCLVTGDSMERVLFDGDLVSIDVTARQVVDDAVYAIVAAGQLKVKYLRRRRDGGLQIISENSARFPMEEVAPEDLHTVYIIGRAFDRSGRGGLGWKR